MKRYLNTLLIFVFAVSCISAQSYNRCGTTGGQDVIDRLLDNRRKMPTLFANRTAATIYVPVQFHLIADNSGNGRIDINDVIDNMCQLNNDYADQDVVFYLYDEPNEINNSLIYDFDSQSATDIAFTRSFKVAGVMNIFISNEISNLFTTGTTLGVHVRGFNNDFIYAIKSTVNATSATLTHEIGHFFSLPHPFLGWGENDYTGGNAPATDPSGNPTELQDRSNCSVAGDLFCDTYPNYFFGFSTSGCNYTGGARDSNGELVTPDTDNYMSYFNDACTNKFSQEQKDAMMADIMVRNFDNSYFPASTAQVNSSSVIWAPWTGQIVPHDDLQFGWNATPSVAGYVVTVERLFNGNPINVAFSGFKGSISTVLTVDRDAFLPNNDYRVSVRPISEIPDCNYTPTYTTFRVGDFGTNTTSIEGVNDLQLLPNIASASQPVRLVVNSKQDLDASVKIYGTNGQLYKSLDQLSITSGRHVQEIDINGLGAGIYLVTFETSKGQISKKLVVTN